MPTSTHPAAAVPAQLAQAWNAGDAAAYAALFTADATYIVFDGTVLRGAAGIEDAHRWLFAGPLKGSRMGGAGPAEVRVLGDGVAHVLVEGGVRPDGAEQLAADRASVVSLVLVESPGGWRIAAFHNTRVQERQR